MTLNLNDYELDLLHDAVVKHRTETSNDVLAEHLKTLQQKIEEEMDA